MVKTKSSDLSRRDRELCHRYLEELEGKGLSVYEPWERELEAWAVDPSRYPRVSTLVKLRLRFLEDQQH